jgi:hypothetical protein
MVGVDDAAPPVAVGEGDIGVLLEAEGVDVQVAHGRFPVGPP